MSRPDEPVFPALFPAMAILCQLLYILHSNSVLLEVTCNDVKSSDVGFASKSSPACGPQAKLEWFLSDGREEGVGLVGRVRVRRFTTTPYDGMGKGMVH